MSIESAFTSLSRLDQHVDTVNALKNGGSLEKKDGVIRHVERGVWDFITRKKPDPVQNLQCLETMEREIEESIQLLRNLILYSDADDALKQQTASTLAAIMAKYDPSALDAFEKNFEQQFVKMAEQNEMSVEKFKATLAKGNVDQISQNFSGKVKTKIDRAIAALKISAPASRVTNSVAVRNFFGMRTGGVAESIKRSLENALGEATMGGVRAADPAMRRMDVAPELQQVPGTEAAPPPTGGAAAVPPPPGVAPPPPPPAPKVMSAEEKAALKKQKVDAAKEVKREAEANVYKKEVEIDAAKENSRGIYSQVKEMRAALRDLEKIAKSTQGFEEYSFALRTLGEVRDLVHSSESALTLFKAENSPRAEILRAFLQSGKGSIELSVTRMLMNPDKGVEEAVEQRVTIDRDRAEKLLDEEYEKPLKDLEEALEGAQRAVDTKEQVIAQNEGNTIEGESFEKFALRYNKLSEEFGVLEEAWRRAGNRVQDLQKEKVAVDEALKQAEVKLASLENRKARVKVVTEEKFDPREVFKAFRQGKGMIHLGDITLKGRVTYGDVPLKEAKRAQSSPVEGTIDKENTSQPVKKSFVRKVFGRILG